MPGLGSSSHVTQRLTHIVHFFSVVPIVAVLQSSTIPFADTIVLVLVQVVEERVAELAVVCCRSIRSSKYLLAVVTQVLRGSIVLSPFWIFFFVSFEL